MARSGNPGAFETIVDRYQGRLLGFCRQMLGSTEDAEDVLQEVFVNAYRAMLADEREINLRPWLYRIARNRCLNHLRKPSADAQESMDMVPEVEAASTAEKVHNREEFRQILSDVNKLPETQRSALLLREMDALSYEEIADAMETTVPSVKSLLVRARISLAEASQARLLTCGEVRVELSEAAEGLRKVSAPVRRHVRECDECADFRSQIRSNEKLLAALFPIPALLAFKGFIASKLGLGGGSAASGAAASGAAAGGGAAAAGGAASGIGAALGGGGAAGGLGGIGGAIGGAIGTKAVAGVVTAAVLTAGAAVELPKEHHSTPPAPIVKSFPTNVESTTPQSGGIGAAIAATEQAEPKVAISTNAVAAAPTKAEESEVTEVAPVETAAPPVEEEAAVPPEEAQAVEEPAAGASDVEEGSVSGGVEVETAITASPSTAAGAHGGKPTVTVTVTPETPVSTPPPPPAEATPPPAEAPPVETEAAAASPEGAVETAPGAEETP
ncbi:MAG TPA: sigma-70 family RNA polymerase sigma factor [Solirubrobacterales bacterium]